MQQVQELMKEHFNKMCSTGRLFKSKVTGKEVWDLYLNGFSPKNDPVFRDPNSSEHNCNHCYSFIKRYGNIVALSENDEIITLFDIDVDEEYKNSFKLIRNKLKKAKIEDVFVETVRDLQKTKYEENVTTNQTSYKLGLSSNVKRYTKEEAELYGVVKPNEIRKFHHFSVDVPTSFIDKSGDSVEAIASYYRNKYHVFKRGLQEISVDTLNLVIDLINQGSLLDGNAHLHAVEEFKSLIQSIGNISTRDVELLDNWIWRVSSNIDERTATFRNTLVGTLCVELSEGEDLNKACQNWNKRVDPANYMKATAPITQRQINEAQKFVEENGYTQSFERRFATLDDIKVSEIKHINSEQENKSISVFDNVKPTSTRHKRNKFDNVEEVSIEKFMKDILPNCYSVEALLENRMESNLVTLTTSKHKDSKPIFKWNNNYSWTFNGNLAGKSEIKNAVKSRGGNTEGVLNIRLAFPNTAHDYDLHVFEPGGNHIYFSNVRSIHKSSGQLDLDAQGVDGTFPPEKRVENVIYTDINKMKDGNYIIKVNNYTKPSLRIPFKMEIETLNDTITLESIPNNNGTITVGYVNLSNGEFTFKANEDSVKVSDSQLISKEIWGLQTNEFHKINLVCLSPNHWGDNQVGNKHYMFMLEGCKTPYRTRSFHNENLNQNLLKHRKVMEVLGSTTILEPSNDQLSGIGFNSTVKNELTVRCKGNFNRILKIKF